MAQIRGVLLDVDGTLIDSNDAHALAWIDALEEFEYDVPFEKIRPLIGKGGDKILPELTGQSSDSEQGKQIGQQRTEIFKERYLPEVRAFPRARDPLKRMRDDGLKLVVATSATPDEMKALLKVVGAEDLMADETSSGDAKNSKPDPDIVQAALGKIGYPANEVVMFGDTPYDVEVATKAGVSVIALRGGGWKDDELAGAAAIYENPRDLLERYDESPLGRKTAAA